jgi:hypothetical protein
MMIASHLYPGKDALTSFDVHEYFLRQGGSSAKRSRIESLRGKRVLVLGGTSGIGLAVAEAAAREGATAIVASSNAANAHAALARLRSLFERTVAFDYLVFSAGESLELGRPADTRLDEARKFFELRYWGALTELKYGGLPSGMVGPSSLPPASPGQGRTPVGRSALAAARPWKG